LVEFLDIDWDETSKNHWLKCQLSATEGLRREIAEIQRTGIAFDRDEYTHGISAAAIAQRRGRQRDRHLGAGAHRALPRKRAAHRLGIARGSLFARLDEIKPR
jgi:Bacterial transcriptional regulator